MPHLVSPEAEALLDKEHKVLDYGFVRLVDYMGGDQRVVDAARTSYQAGTKIVNSDRGLIRYLVRHKHTTPLEKVRFEFHIKLPIFVMRQLIRHRMASVNEESARYSILSEEFYLPDHLRKQSTSNKQGSSDEILVEFNRLIRMGDASYYEKDNTGEALRRHCKDSYSLYEDLLKDGAARELARMVLPVNIYTQFYWTIDLHNLMHFLKLRLDKHAQLEIQEFAKPIEMCARAVAPLCMEAWTDYVNDARTLSRMEVGAIRSFLISLGAGTPEGNAKLQQAFELMSEGSGLHARTEKGGFTREYSEFIDLLGIT